MKKVLSRRIALKPFNNKVFYNNKIFNIDSGHNVFLNFKRRIKKYGVNISTIDINDKLPVDRYVYCDVPYPWEFHTWYKLLSNTKKNVLFTFESPLVNPFSHLRFISSLFKKIFTWDETVIDNKKYFNFYIPQLNLQRHEKLKKFKYKKLLVAVYSNKSAPTFFKLLSPFKSDLYKERVRAIEFFDSKIPTKFSLFGYGWNKPKAFGLKEKMFGFKRYSTYRGEVGDKIKLISRFKFCLAFENAVAPGYITEKIFDCFKAGCVPIYLGAPNVGKYIPKGSFIDYRDFKGYEDLLDFLNSIGEKKYNGYIRNAQEFLKKKSTQNTWFENSFDKTFLAAIS